jgi:hypothetical protein
MFTDEMIELIMTQSKLYAVQKGLIVSVITGRIICIINSISISNMNMIFSVIFSSFPHNVFNNCDMFFQIIISWS